MKTILVEADTISRGWEEATLRCWEEGDRFKTEYDKTTDQWSRDVTLLLHIKRPLQEPRIHRAICHSIDFLEEYRLELLEAIHDYYMDDLDNPNRWSYTYASRMFRYSVPCDECAKTPGGQPCRKCGSTGYIHINQIGECIKKLKKTGYSRRIQSILWNPATDLYIDDPPCLNVINLRVQKVACPECEGTGKSHFENDYYDTCKTCNSQGTLPKLNMIVIFRSHDAYKAAYSNLFALSELQKYIAEQVGVGVGSLVLHSLSYHIYGSYFDEFKGFLKTVKERTFEERTYTSEFCIPFWIEACTKILKEEKLPPDKRVIVEERKKYLEHLLAK